MYTDRETVQRIANTCMILVGELKVSILVTNMEKASHWCSRSKTGNRAIDDQLLPFTFDLLHSYDKFDDDMKQGGSQIGRAPNTNQHTRRSLSIAEELIVHKPTICTFMQCVFAVTTK